MIYAIKNGKVVEKGTHEELLKLNGYYASLVKSQINSEEIQEKLNHHNSSNNANENINNNEEEDNDDEINKKRKTKTQKKINPYSIWTYFNFI